ncbi:GxGYxYP domain-containing protein [Bacillus sp. SA1-12]|uniref:GxGYxYP domain-containing protein n=1 Tax=Bacillus sp. SA1-12 TaxID=1455638 RepID=UPI000A7C1D38|nr:GxGYxYP domain-containing protein [Bacillus sp. SA1-12]
MIRNLMILTLVTLCTLSLTFGASASAGTPPHNSSVKWPKHQELPTFAKVKHLDVANVHEESGDIKILLATLQGIVNKEKPRIYVQQNEADPWLNDLQVPYKLHDDAMVVFRAYMDEIEGIIIYDPEVPDSINVATTLAGLKNAVVASPELAQQLTSAPYNLKVIKDFQGQFNNRMEAYTWQYENLWSQTTKRMLVGLSPNTSIPIPPDNYESFQRIAVEKEQIRDQSNRETYEFDLSSFLGNEAVYLRFNDAFTQDGWGPAVHEIVVKADGQTIAQFNTGTPEEEPFLYDKHGSKFLPGSDHRFADNGNYFMYEFKPPAGTKQLRVYVDMWNQFAVSASKVRPLSSEQKEPYGYLRDYAVANKAMVFWLSTSVPEEKELFEKILSDVEPGTPYLGWFDNDFEGEVAGIDITSKHGVYVLPSDWFHNMTVFSGTKHKNVMTKKPEAPKLENKIYVTYTFGEGDNLQYDQNHMRNLWNDPARGKVPINWTSSPMLYDAAPAILNYYQSTATENDLLVAGPSGVGYFSPYAWPEEHFSDFLNDTYSYMKKSKMSYPYVLNRDVAVDLPLSETKAAAYENNYKVPGLFLGGGEKVGIEIMNGSLPISYLRGISTVQDGINILADYKRDWDGKSPKFISIGINAWGMNPSHVLALTETLGPEYEVVRADEYFSLVREAYGLTSANKAD